jgi:hypothetical protein
MAKDKEGVGMTPLEKKFVENSDMPEFYQWLIEECGFTVKKELE